MDWQDACREWGLSTGPGKGRNSWTCSFASAYFGARTGGSTGTHSDQDDASGI